VLLLDAKGRSSGAMRPSAPTTSAWTRCATCAAVTNLVRAPAFVAYLQAGLPDEP
jgi:hypothetical protein